MQEAGWTPGPVWTGAENLAYTGIRSPDRPARSQSLYRLSYRGPHSRIRVSHNLYSSVNTVRIFGHPVLRVEHVSRNVRGEKCIQNCGRNTGRKRPWGRPGRRWDDNIPHLWSPNDCMITNLNEWGRNLGTRIPRCILVILVVLDHSVIFKVIIPDVVLIRLSS